MSNRGTFHKRPGRHRLAGDEVVAIQLAWARDADALAEARQSSHDRLIESMGPARTGGVTWRQLATRSEALSFLERMLPGAEPEAEAYYRDLAGLVIRHGGILVIASAPGRPPPATVVR